MSGPMALEPGGTAGDALSLRLADARTPARSASGPGADGEAVDRLAAELAEESDLRSTRTRWRPCWSRRG